MEKIFGVISENKINIIETCKELEILIGQEIREVTTEFGTLKKVNIVKCDNFTLIYIPYNGRCEGLDITNSIPAIFNYFRTLHITNVIGVGLVGSLNRLLRPGDIVIPDDIIDFTKNRHRSVLEHEFPGITMNYRCNEIFCPKIRKIMFEIIKKKYPYIRTFDRSTYFCTEGPRFETPAEIRAFQGLGGDVVAFSAGSEVLTAKEYNICYANLSLVTNYGEGLYSDLGEIEEISQEFKSKISSKIIIYSIEKMILEKDRCNCKNSWLTIPVMR